MSIKISKQEAFNKAYVGLRNQNWRMSFLVSAKHMHDMCSYRGENGTKCAIGHLIPDNIAEQCMFSTAANLVQEGHLRLTDHNNLTLTIDFFTELQQCHDAASSPAGMQQLLAEFVAKYKLDIPSDK